MEKLIDLPKILDDRGNLTFLENQKQFPFKIKRVFWIYDVPGGQRRGGHAYFEQQEIIIALSGSFDVVVNNGNQQNKYHLNRSYSGLFVPNGLWRHLENFSTNSVALVLCSTDYDEADYIRDFNKYKEFLNEKLCL